MDNYTEYVRSIELPEFLAKVYETNYLINICEYVIVMDQDTFVENSGPIREVLSRLSQNYLFDDVGFTQKNAYNWGLREAKLTQEEMDLYDNEIQYDVVILDYGYLYPLYNQADDLFTCPKCGKRLRWSNTYTTIHCGGNCGFSVTPMGLRRKMDLSFENIENEMISNFNNTKMPDLVNVEKIIKDIKEDKE